MTSIKKIVPAGSGAPETPGGTPAPSGTAPPLGKQVSEVSKRDCYVRAVTTPETQTPPHATLTLVVPVSREKQQLAGGWIKVAAGILSSGVIFVNDPELKIRIEKEAQRLQIWALEVLTLGIQEHPNPQPLLVHPELLKSYLEKITLGLEAFDPVIEARFRHWGQHVKSLREIVEFMEQGWKLQNSRRRVMTASERRLMEMLSSQDGIEATRGTSPSFLVHSVQRRLSQFVVFFSEALQGLRQTPQLLTGSLQEKILLELQPEGIEDSTSEKRLKTLRRLGRIFLYMADFLGTPSQKVRDMGELGRKLAGFSSKRESTPGIRLRALIVMHFKMVLSLMPDKNFDMSLLSEEEFRALALAQMTFIELTAQLGSVPKINALLTKGFYACQRKLASKKKSTNPKAVFRQWKQHTNLPDGISLAKALWTNKPQAEERKNSIKTSPKAALSPGFNRFPPAKFKPLRPSFVLNQAAPLRRPFLTPAVPTSNLFSQPNQISAPSTLPSLPIQSARFLIS